MNQFRILGLVILCSSCLYFTACDEEEPNPMGVCDTINATYNGDVKAIINGSCAVVGCHDGDGNYVPAGSENFTTFDGLMENLDNGNFNTEVLINNTMPPGVALEDSDIEILQCWKDAGFPEN